MRYEYSWPQSVSRQLDNLVKMERMKLCQIRTWQYIERSIGQDIFMQGNDPKHTKNLKNIIKLKFSDMKFNVECN